MDVKEIRYLNKTDKKRNNKFDKKSSRFKDMYQESKLTKQSYKRDNHKTFHDYLEEEIN